MTNPVRINVFQRRIQWIALQIPLLLIIVVMVNGLHEDQIGKFDWRQRYIGKPIFLQPRLQSNSLIVVTQRNVIASLNLKDGSLIWRQLLSDCKEIKSAHSDSVEFPTYIKTTCQDETSIVWNSQTGLVGVLPKDRNSTSINFPFSSGAKLSTEIWPESKRPTFDFRDKDVVSAFLISEKPDSKILLINNDYTMSLYDKNGKKLWARNEALAYVISAEFVDLPPTTKDDHDYSVNSMDLVKLFINRLRHQYWHLQEFIFNSPLAIADAMTQLADRAKSLLFNLQVPISQGDKLSQHKDVFGLHKLIVVLCENGKLFGLDFISGDVAWSIYEPSAASSPSSRQHAQLYILKNTLRSIGDSLAAVIHPNGHLLAFNPLNGQKHSIPSKLSLKPIKQIMPLNAREEDKLVGLLLLDIDNKVIIFPEDYKPTFIEKISKYFLSVAERSPPSMQGFRFVSSKDMSSGKEVISIKAESTWRVPFVDDSEIVEVAFKRLGEPVHSPARVLGDRNVLYKYLNPNLVAVVSRGYDNSTQPADTYTNIFLLDSVTGSIVYTAHHPKTRGPTRIVHSENWLVYSYFGYKVRRTELSSIELFEGSEQANSTAFSSLSRSGVQPKVVEHKSFIFPNGIEAMKDTLTKRGITYKHVIVGLPSGALLELPKIYLDPRRPVDMLPEHREEGLVQYIPELPIPAESMINYNQTILSIRGIQTAPTKLESTCLVFAYGLDLFSTRVTPSKTFDILKDDFDHLLIAAVLIFLTAASYVCKMLAQRKALFNAWK